MQATNFSVSSYLKRIGYIGTPVADMASVARMMRLQLHTIPFENLDVQAGKAISLVPEDIVEKIIHKHRGGYCYELNGLFSMALTAIGVPYCWVAARPMFYPMRRPKTHMAIVMELEGHQWLVDLGFGSYGINEPLALDNLNAAVTQGFDTFKLTRLDGGDYLLQALVDDAWTNQYSFDLIAQEWIDFDPVNYLNSTHPDAVFVKSLLVINHYASGRNILFGNSLKTIDSGHVSKRTVETHEIDGVLKTIFGLQRPTI